MVYFVKVDVFIFDTLFKIGFLSVEFDKFRCISISPNS